MATYGSQVRRGLPRTPGGDPWPPAGDAPAEAVEAPVAPRAERDGTGPTDERVQTSAQPRVDPVAAGTAAAESSRVAGADSAGSPFVTTEGVVAGAVGGESSRVAGADSAGSPFVTTQETSAPTAGAPIRRGLPRTPGGEPWPPAREVAVAAASVVPVESSQLAGADAVASPSATTEAGVAAVGAVASSRVGDAAAGSPPATREAAPAEGTPLRRGLPRVAGGEPWPAAGFAPDRAAAVAARPAAAVAAAQPAAAAAATSARPAVGASVPGSATAVALAERAPLTVPQTVWPGPAARAFEAERLSGTRVTAPEPERIGPFTKAQWAGAVIVGGAGLLFAAGMAVVFVRWLLSLEFMQEFLVAYPGEYHLPEGAPVGFPGWLGWQHFFNVFLMVLIIRSGLQVRTEKRPTAFWAPRGDTGNGKISLNLWFHQSLDILWLVNGVIFVVLLFVTGQWMRIIPTSWEVFPNALSATLQYVSLDWPTENGWVNYNSLQQLTYFATVFLAAPLAAITGARMTKLWPANAKTLNRIYPVEWARAIHFPVMLYFVLFIIVHVTLVFATGALRNLNHMYAAQGSVDGVQYADNWAGFWIFVASLVVIAAAWVAARPLTLAPIARLFGTVTGR